MKLGLTIGAGGARMSAVGPIVDFLQEKGIKFDMYSGSSGGGAAALYYGIFETNKVAWDIFTNQRAIDFFFKMVDPTISRKSIFKGNKLKKIMTEYFFQDKTFKDLRIPAIVTATSLTTKKTVYFDKGNLIDAAMASVAVPGIYPPYKIRKDYFIDGGLLEPLPVQCLLDNGIDKVIAVDFYNTVNENVIMKKGHLMALSISMILEKLSPNPNPKKVFIIKPKFTSPSYNMKNFHHWKKFWAEGEQTIKEVWPKLSKWLKE